MSTFWSVFVAECRRCGETYERVAINSDGGDPTRTRCPHCSATNIAQPVAPGDDLEELHGDGYAGHVDPDWLVGDADVHFDEGVDA